jgi:hypothetical protein
MWLPGVHKQLANRLLMPWTMTTMVMTAVDVYWEHFMSLRDHYMAQDEVQDVAHAFANAYTLSTPDVLVEGEWHLPFIDETDYQYVHDLYIGDQKLITLLQLSYARCARTSYAPDHETLLTARFDYASDISLCNRIIVQKPAHDGPREHQAQAHSDPNHRSGNLHGWDQLRHHPASKALEAVATQPALRGQQA